jgi:hypothetical protein
MGFTPLIAVYAVAMALIWTGYVVSRIRGEARSRATKAAAAEAGLTEPASIHPKIRPGEMSGLWRLCRRLSRGGYYRHDQREGRAR